MSDKDKPGMIPNSFQTPNTYMDDALYCLTGDEIKCLMFATRHILGWQDSFTDRRKRISLSVFENGFTTVRGTVFSGTGLTRPRIVKALQGLKQYDLLIAVGEPTEQGQEWEVGLHPDIKGLQKRHSETKEAQRNRTAKATQARSAAGGNASVTSNVDVDVDVTHKKTKKNKVVTKVTSDTAKYPKEASNLDLLVLSVAKHIFDDPTPGGLLLDKTPWQIKAIALWLDGIGTGTKRTPVPLYDGKASPSEVKDFKAWWDNTKKINRPYDLSKFRSGWIEWKSEHAKTITRLTQSQDTAPEPEPEPVVSDEDRRASVEALRQVRQQMGLRS